MKVIINKEATAKNIKIAMEKHGYNKRNLAKELSYSECSVGRWLRGDYLPSLEILILLSFLFDTTVEELIEYEVL